MTPVANVGPDDLAYTDVPEAARTRTAGQNDRGHLVGELIGTLSQVLPPPGNSDGEVEVLDGVEMVHRFVDAPGDSELVRWHLVEAGDQSAEPVVFLHGLPESWYMWHRQMAALAPRHRVVSVDLKGYGQSDKRTGDYRQEGVAEQLIALLDQLGLDEFSLVTHDRGSVVADYLGATHAKRVLRYVRGQQHLYYFNPELAPQEQMFINPETVGMLSQPAVTVAAVFTNLTRHPVDEADLVRTVQEFSHAHIGWAVPRYFNSSSFRQEWIDRRRRLIEAWQFPVLVLQGEYDPMQPREFYEDASDHLPDAEILFLDAGHFFVYESPDRTTAAIADFLSRP